jgi:hypothetical protein
MANTASAQPVAELPSAVSAFRNACLTGGLDVAGRPAALVAAGWTKTESTTVDVSKLGVSRAIDRNYDFSKPLSSEQWSGTVDGRPAMVVLASFPEKRRYPQLCALVVDGINNAMPYSAELKAAFEEIGIKAKSVDLVHYYEFAGKAGVDKQPVRGEIFTRSLASSGKNSMHIYVAY